MLNDLTRLQNFSRNLHLSVKLINLAATELRLMHLAHPVSSSVTEGMEIAWHRIIFVMHSNGLLPRA